MSYLGALTFAVGSDYQVMAAAQARSWARVGIPMTVVITGQAIPELTRSEANIVYLDMPVTKPFEFEKYAYMLSPYHVTIKTDADLIVPGQWRPSPLLTEMPLVSAQPITVQGVKMESSPYREAYAVLNLPQVYSAFFTFRKGPDASTFFRYVDEIFSSYYATDLPNVEPSPSTDLVYSVAWARLFSSTDLGYTTPFLHMKHGAHGLLSRSQDWTTEISFDMDRHGQIYLNGYQVYHPLHYHNKSLVSRLF